MYFIFVHRVVVFCSYRRAVLIDGTRRRALGNKRSWIALRAAAAVPRGAAGAATATERAGAVAAFRGRSQIKKGVNLISRTNAFVHNWQLALAIGIAGNMACHTHTHTHMNTHIQTYIRTHSRQLTARSAFAFCIWPAATNICPCSFYVALHWCVCLSVCVPVCVCAVFFCQRFLKNGSNY